MRAGVHRSCSDGKELPLEEPGEDRAVVKRKIGVEQGF